MCGLLGFAAQEDADFPPELAGYLLNKLQLRNELRGGDSFGLGLVEPDVEESRLYKTVGKISDLGMDGAPAWKGGVKRLMRVLAAERPVVAIGHNRKATTGANTERNAHPFKVGKEERGDFVLGAHNGVVGSWRGVKTQWEFSRKLEVDSEVIFRGLQKFHDESDMDEIVLGQLVPLASMAVSYMTDFKELKLFREANPLHVALGDGFIFWSSLEKHIDEETFGLNTKKRKLAKNKLYRLDLESWDFHASSIQPNHELESSLYTGSDQGYQTRGRFYRGNRRRDRNRRSQITRDQGRERAESGVHHHIFGEDTGEQAYLPDSRTAPSAQSGESRNSHGEESPGDADADGSDAPARDSDGSEFDPSDLDAKVDGQIRPKIWALNSSERTHEGEPVQCALCDNSNFEPDEGEQLHRWQLLWYNGEAFCPVCFYFMYQADAEKNLGAILDDSNRA